MLAISWMEPVCAVSCLVGGFRLGSGVGGEGHRIDYNNDSQGSITSY